MIDFHSHILPAMDDGSKDVEESCALLNMLYRGGVKTVAATPHFYADNESVEAFLSRRTASYNSLKTELTEDMPNIVLGAEIKYYQGISHLEGLDSLCIENSNLLLLEMPFCKWTEYTVKEVINIAGNGNITVVLAHIERYIRLQSKKVFENLIESGILMQSNADFFLGIATRKKALKMLFEGNIQLIGSDCHNLDSRSPRISEAFIRIQKKFGDDFVKYINDYENGLFFNP